MIHPLGPDIFLSAFFFFHKWHLLDHVTQVAVPLALQLRSAGEVFLSLGPHQS